MGQDIADDAGRCCRHPRRWGHRKQPGRGGQGRLGPRQISDSQVDQGLAGGTRGGGPKQRHGQEVDRRRGEQPRHPTSLTGAGSDISWTDVMRTTPGSSRVDRPRPATTGRGSVAPVPVRRRLRWGPSTSGARSIRGPGSSPMLRRRAPVTAASTVVDGDASGQTNLCIGSRTPGPESRRVPTRPRPAPVRSRPVGAGEDRGGGERPSGGRARRPASTSSSNCRRRRWARRQSPERPGGAPDAAVHGPGGGPATGHVRGSGKRSLLSSDSPSATTWWKLQHHGDVAVVEPSMSQRSHGEVVRIEGRPNRSATNRRNKIYLRCGEHGVRGCVATGSKSTSSDQTRRARPGCFVCRTRWRNRIRWMQAATWSRSRRAAGLSVSRRSPSKQHRARRSGAGPPVRWRTRGRVLRAPVAPSCTRSPLIVRARRATAGSATVRHRPRPTDSPTIGWPQGLLRQPVCGSGRSAPAWPARSSADECPWPGHRREGSSVPSEVRRSCGSDG